MRNLLINIVILALVLFVLTYLNPLWFGQIQELVTPPCSSPIEYKVGIIDERFKVSEGEFKADIAQAASIWNNSTGKKLFLYNPNAKLSINLVFDERQSLKDQVDQIKSDLEEQKDKIRPTEEAYKKQVAEFKNRLAELNSKIEYWNNQGGAPKEEYEKLLKEQDELKAKAEQINQMATSLNKSADDYNSGVDQLRQTAGNFNEVLQNKPEEGLFDPNLDKIDIYINDNQKELIHTLAHELGHALGMEHVDGKTSILYPFTSDKINPSSFDLAEIDKVCNAPIKVFTIFSSRN